MPIDSLCSGCGKTLRVNDEFQGRKARCPACGTVYIAGGVPSEQYPSPAEVETIYPVQKDSGSLSSNPVDDSWNSLPSAKPIEESSAKTIGAMRPATPQSPPHFDGVTASSPLVGSSIASPPDKMYFVRTPNSMIYGPSSALMVHDWIAQGRLDDTCHIREETSEQWLGIPAWRFQSRKQQNPISNPANSSTNQFGAVPVSSVQSLGYTKSGNGTIVLVLGLVSWVLCPTVIGALICSIIATVFAMTELKKIREGISPSKEKSLVLIGLFLALANLAAISITIIAFVAIAILNP